MSSAYAEVWYFVTISIPIYASSMLSLEGVFYTVTKANIYAAHKLTTLSSLHFSSHTLPISRGRLFTLYSCSIRKTFPIILCIPEHRLYYWFHLHSVSVHCSKTIIQERPHHRFLFRLAIAHIFECQWTPGYITCGVTKSSVSEPERVWSADAREVFEPCSVMDEAAALQEEKTEIRFWKIILNV